MASQTFCCPQSVAQFPDPSLKDKRMESMMRPKPTNEWIHMCQDRFYRTQSSLETAKVGRLTSGEIAH